MFVIEASLKMLFMYISRFLNHFIIRFLSEKCPKFKNMLRTYKANIRKGKELLFWILHKSWKQLFYLLVFISTISLASVCVHLLAFKP